MDIQAYNEILKGLQEYNELLKDNYNNAVVPIAPVNTTTYPLTIFDEIRNQQDERYRNRHDKVSSLGYRLDVYAKDKKGVNRQVIAREIAKDMDDYLQMVVGLTQISYNVVPLLNDASIYHIVITYRCNFLENRRKII